VVSFKGGAGHSQDVAYLEAILRKLNPKARLVRATTAAVALEEILNTRQFDMNEAASQAWSFKNCVLPALRTLARSRG
jgi:G3E family GTPase